MPIELAGSLVLLREFAPSDRAAFVAQADDQAMFEFMKFRYESRDAADRHFTSILRATRLDGDVQWLVVESLDDERFAGWAGVGPWNAQTEFGWYLTSTYWGRGFATEATLLILQWSFGDKGCEQMMATCDPQNLASRRVLEKCRLVPRGELSEPIMTWRGQRPRLLYTLTREQWGHARPS